MKLRFFYLEENHFEKDEESVNLFFERDIAVFIGGFFRFALFSRQLKKNCH